jgi:uncharacterized protein (TIGR03084 family)
MKKICNDLAAEYNNLDTIVSKLDEQQWNIITPFYEWSIKDEIIHIAYFDERARLSVDDPDAFARHKKKSVKKPKDFNEKTMTPYLDPSITELLSWWRIEREKLLTLCKEKKPTDRISWYGPTMSATSFIAARMMEVWAHAQDVCDALNIRRPATDRLYHIAHIGVITFGWSFANRKIGIPDTPIRVELESSDNDIWVWGPKEAKEVVKGSAEGFCQIVTQRRNVADTDIKTYGTVAAKWMKIAQAFAGPPENGPAAK